MRGDREREREKENIEKENRERERKKTYKVHFQIKTWGSYSWHNLVYYQPTNDWFDHGSNKSSHAKHKICFKSMLSEWAATTQLLSVDIISQQISIARFCIRLLINRGALNKTDLYLLSTFH